MTLTINSGGVLMTPNVSNHMITAFQYNGGNEFVSFFITSGNAQNDLIVNQDAPNGALAFDCSVEITPAGRL